MFLLRTDDGQKELAFGDGLTSEAEVGQQMGVKFNECWYATKGKGQIVLRVEYADDGTSRRRSDVMKRAERYSEMLIKALGRESTSKGAGSVENELMGIWEDLLGACVLNSKSNFFDVGGHSLLASLFTDFKNSNFNSSRPFD